MGEQWPNTSHPIRLTVWMVVGMLAGIRFCPDWPINRLDWWELSRPFNYMLIGAVAGLLIELFCRLLQSLWPDYSR